MSLGSWNINVSIGSMPEKVATAFAKLNEMVGCEYSPIAYLGSQVVNGTNHAVLAEQTVLAGKDTKNIVLVIFNEKGNECSVVNIERVVESGAPLGGVTVNVETAEEIDKTAQRVFDETFAGYVGCKVTSIALLGTQVVRGIEYIFACEVTPVVPGGASKVSLVKINDMDNDVQFVDLLASNAEVDAVQGVKGNLRLSSPWVIFYKEVSAFFQEDPEVTVLFNNEEPELKIQVKGNDEKAACIARFFPKERAFGNVILKCSVVGDDGQPVPDINCDDKTAIDLMFKGNGAVSFIKKVDTIFGYTIVYVVFAREVVSYYSDNMYDIYGATSTLYQDLAAEIFGQLLHGDYCSFCTDAEVSVGCPLGEWP